ncbi:MAG: HNH endonuclease [Verrucomicrobia bacterium]|nr:HNH endonuclease [Verrucomicrobiota bacterium]
MKFYVGVTNNDWFAYLAARRPDEVNFWRPRSQNQFRAIEIGAPFLFKLHSPLNFIVGGGLLVAHKFLPLSLMWQAFGERNGVPDYQTLRDRILEHRRQDELGLQIGCTILGEPFFFERDEWIPVPESWRSNIVSGRCYSTAEPDGLRLWEQVLERLGAVRLQSNFGAPENPGSRYGAPQLVLPRLGQGGFRVLVTEAYGRRCAFTGERTMPALEAAHIRPYALQGPHAVSNGLLLRSDWHHLFDEGYATLDEDNRIVVSSRIRKEFENGKEYYRLHGQPVTLPQEHRDRPNEDHLAWHRSRFVA